MNLVDLAELAGLCRNSRSCFVKMLMFHAQLSLDLRIIV